MALLEIDIFKLYETPFEAAGVARKETKSGLQFNSARMDYLSLKSGHRMFNSTLLIELYLLQR